MRTSLILLSLLGLSFAGAATAFARNGSGGFVDPGRDCQTIRTCNWTRGGSWRGCVSSYSCRACRFVPDTCAIGGSRPSQKLCGRMRCSWGA